MSRPTQVTLNLPALRHNLQQIKKLAPHSAILAMVKSNAYGHGLERVAMALPNADAFGVASLEEGLFLRRAGVTAPIVLMEGLFSDAELEQAVAGNFTLVLHEADQVAMLEKQKLPQPVSVWVKIDTGMHRLGFAPPAVAKVYERLLVCANVKKPLGFMTHFSSANHLDQPITSQQIELFNQVTGQFPGPRSLANSAGILAWPQAHADWVRPGILLYGVSPLDQQLGTEDFRPVMTFSSALIAIHDLRKGDAVGYSGTWVCPEDMRVGVVGAGYGDGYPLHAPNGTPVLVNGVVCPLAGRVSMDMLTVDLRSQPQAKIGDSVILWGKDLPVTTVAKHSQTISYELLTRITQRVRVAVEA